MPKKAIVASSRGKGLRLVLLGPIKQSQSTQESLQSAQKSGLSTQESPSQSTQQAKQSKADYAFPIQTLQFYITFTEVREARERSAESSL
ncbi:hypothetical protein PIB30_093450, partial [Stylosanthes scabra]|nr:hypothetical protein [Stylosanthes scabra]